MKQAVQAPSQPASDEVTPAQGVSPSVNPTSLVTEGLKLQNAGQFEAAARIYRQALAIKPDHFDALHLLGVIFHQCGHQVQAAQQIEIALAVSPDNVFGLNNYGIVLESLQRSDEALASLDRALTLDPDYAEAWLNRGNTLQNLKRFAEALASYDRAIALRQNYPEAWSNRSNVLKALGRLDEALASCDRALALRPNYPQALLNRGNALKDLKRYAEALQSYEGALALWADYVEALSNRSAMLCEFKRFEEALISCDRALALRPDFAEAHSNRGNALHGLERFEEALASYERAVVLRPSFVEAQANRGGALHALKRFEEALSVYNRAVALMPNRPETHYNRANVLHSLKRFDEALASYDHALALRPNYVEPLANRGVALHDLKRFDEALASYDRVRVVQSDFEDAHYNEALCRLLTGDFKLGFEQFEWRWEIDQHRHAKRNFLQPLWTGAQELDGKTILLHAEQGFGDTIQFCRYAPLVAARGARVVLEVQEPLRVLAATLPGVAQLLSRGERLPDFDLQCPLLSLPRSFATDLSTIPNATPYLHVSPEAVAKWQARLGAEGRPRIGIAWSGRPTHKNDHNRSIALATFLQIFAGLDATIVSLQREVREADAATLRGRGDVVHFGEELGDFSDTAALAANLDLVIAVDTSVAHLAGALARPVWVLLPFIPDWRWLLDRDDCPWYPTTRLFRQDESREWEGAIARVNTALRDRFSSAV